MEVFCYNDAVNKNTLLYITFFSTILLWVMHTIGIAYSLYWVYWWFDTVMHILGGFSLGFLSLYIFYGFSIFRDELSFSEIMMVSFIFAMMLGGIWEVFEYVNDLTQSTEKYSLDVVHDLLADALGVILALLVTKRLVKSF